MPNLIVISSLIFSLYVSRFLIVRDECERVLRLKLKLKNKWILLEARRKLTREIATCRAHNWNVNNHDSLEFSRVSRGWGPPAKYSRNILFCYFCYVVLLSIFPHYIYPHYPHIVRSAFQRENPIKYTWELEIIIPTIIYTFSYGFPLLLPLHI